MSEDTYEDDFEDYEDDEFEDDEPAPPGPTGRAPAPAVVAPWCSITLDELSLGDVLASGAMGKVFTAEWRGRQVAVKTLHDHSAAALQACEEELYVHAAACEHPGVVRLHGANLQPPNVCIVMEQCHGSLFERLHLKNGELDRRQLVGMAIDVAEALGFLHSRSPPIVHRDVKSHNVLLDASGRCKLCDFGLVNTREVTAGTPNYMAPELFQAKAYSTSVDVFAFGVLLNEMFSREVPWDGYQPFDIKDKVLAGERPPVPRTMPRACESLLRKAWHQSAVLRPSFAQLLTTLRAVEESLPVGLGASLKGSLGVMPLDALDDFAALGLNKTV